MAPAGGYRPCVTAWRVRGTHVGVAVGHGASGGVGVRRGERVEWTHVSVLDTLALGALLTRQTC
jgi:hypothetical protein